MDGEKEVRLKEIELDILKAFIEICNKNKLRYFLIGGSCLGAIRHHGFIPWDDDIDVGLPREDYNKLMEIGQEQLPDYYFLQNFETDPMYYLNFAKIRDSRTTFIESSIKNLRINHGVFIDVFPLDYYPEHYEKGFKIKNLMLKSRICAEYDASFSAKMIALQRIVKVLYPDVNKAIRQRNELMQSVSKSSLVANLCGAWGIREIMPVDWFGEGLNVPFESLTVRIPTNYHEYLTHLYGDYMTLPPIEKRESHHYTEIIDLDKSYVAYTGKTIRDSN